MKKWYGSSTLLNYITQLHSEDTYVIVVSIEEDSSYTCITLMMYESMCYCILQLVVIYNIICVVVVCNKMMRIRSERRTRTRNKTKRNVYRIVSKSTERLKD